MWIAITRCFPIIRFHAAIVSKRTTRFKRNDLSCRDSCLRGWSIVPILPLRHPRQRLRPRLRATSTSGAHSNHQLCTRARSQLRCTNGDAGPNRWMRSRIATNNSRETATSSIWKTTCREWVTTLAPILMSFSRSVVNDQCLPGFGNANRRKKFPKLYARAKS